MGYSTIQAARHLGVHESTLRNWERCKARGDLRYANYPTPQRHAVNNYRVYTHEDLKAIRQWALTDSLIIDSEFRVTRFDPAEEELSLYRERAQRELTAHIDAFVMRVYPTLDPAIHGPLRVGADISVLNEK